MAPAARTPPDGSPPAAGENIQPRGGGRSYAIVDRGPPRDVRQGDRWLPWHRTEEFERKVRAGVFKHANMEAGRRELAADDREPA
jgi:hypothetical protein